MTEPVLVQHSGFWWPAADQDARGVITNDCPHAVARLLSHVKGRDLIVQAGANVGVYPLALADSFQMVLTAEPDEANYECLKANCLARDHQKRIIHSRAAFGERPGMCEPVVVKGTNCGAHRVEFGGGSVGVITIDWVVATFGRACDAIWLDIEGAELAALKGAERTIEQFSPVLCLEDKGLHRAFGIEDGALQSWLAERGYEQVDRIGQDKLFKRTKTP